MSQWDGKSKGTVLGYKIFVFFIKKVGIKVGLSYPLFCSILLFYFSKKKQYLNLLLF